MPNSTEPRSYPYPETEKQEKEVDELEGDE